MLRNKIHELVICNGNLSDEGRLYICTVLKINNVFAAVIDRRESEMPEKAEGLDSDIKRLNNLLCWLVRCHLNIPKQEKMDSFLYRPAIIGRMNQVCIFQAVCRAGVFSCS